MAPLFFIQALFCYIWRMLDILFILVYNIYITSHLLVTDVNESMLIDKETAICWDKELPFSLLVSFWASSF